MAKSYRGFIYKDANDEWRWFIEAPNGNNIANCGEGYKNKSQAKKMIQKLMGLDEEWNSPTLGQIMFEEVVKNKGAAVD